MPRLFTGLQIPTDIASELAQFRGGISGARWIEQEDYHITLRYIGDVDTMLASDIDEELARIKRAPIGMELGELGIFGGAKPRLVIAKVRTDPQLAGLHADIGRAIRRAGAKSDTRKFSPHVTIARLRNTSPENVAKYLSVRGQFRSWRFLADHFALFSARDSVGGGPYVVEATYPFRDRTPVLPPDNRQ